MRNTSNLYMSPKIRSKPKEKQQILNSNDHFCSHDSVYVTRKIHGVLIMHET